MKAGKQIATLAALAVLGAIALGFFWHARQNPLLIGEVKAAPLQGRDATIGVFLNISNSGGPDRLVGARSIVAQRARLASAVADAGLPIPADSTPSLAPDGAYILMDGVGGTLDEGRMIPITLRFERAGELRTQARLQTPRATGEAARFGLFGIGDICIVEEGEPAPKIALAVEPDGDGWRLRIDAEDFTFSSEMLDGPHVPGMGHAHLYVGGLKLQRVFEPEVRIGALPPGRHEVRVTLNTNDHRAYVVDDLPVIATEVIDVPAP
jgi:copper(I)-binding protein